MKKIIIVGALLGLCAAGTATAASAQASKPEVRAIVQDSRTQIKSVVGPGGAAKLSADQRAAIHAIVTSARQQVAATGATRQQIQAVRQALKIRRAAGRR